jgi:hypothetical protein
MKFESLEPSTQKNKKYMISFSNPKKTIHFGSKTSQTYLDHEDKVKRLNYIKRHRANEDWSKVNAGSLSRFILWGDSTNINTNAVQFLQRFKINI